MRKRITALSPCVLGSALLAIAVAAGEAPRPAKPNVVLLLTDDLGWQDVKCYDVDEPSPMETPNIDALAKKGVMFWQAYCNRVGPQVVLEHQGLRAVNRANLLLWG